MRPVAVVGTASTVVDGGGRDDAELLAPVVATAVASSGLARDDLGIVCSASSEFLNGVVGTMMGAFDAFPGWPPRTHVHHEGDGAFALHEAWIRLQAGEADAALVCAYSRPLADDPARALSLQIDPYLVGPLGPDARQLAALQARALLDAGRYDERSFAEVAAQRLGVDVDGILAQPHLASPLRAADCSRTCSGAVAVVLATGALVDRAVRPPAWITGIAQSIETHAVGGRDLTRSTSTERAAADLQLRGAAIDVLEVHAPFSHQELIVMEAVGARAVGQVNPSGGALPADPTMATGLIRIAAAASAIADDGAALAVGHATNGPCLQHNLLCRLEQRMIGIRCAVVGIGQTVHASARRDVTMGGLVREAVDRARVDAELEWSDIDAVVLGKAPDVLEGVMSPELFLADACGAVGKPIFRAYTSGNAGGVAASLGVSLIRSGQHQRVLVVSFEKQSDGQAAGATLQHVPFEARWQGGTGSLFAAICSQYIHRSGAPSDIGDLAALKDRQNAVRNPYAQVRRPDITLEKIATSRMLWEPIRLLHSSPSSDGACAVVLAAQDAAGGARTPAWVHGCAARTEPPVSPWHDDVNPRAGADCAAAVYAEASITDPATELDVAELFVPYSWMEPMLLENLGLAPTGQGWRLVAEGATRMDGALPVNPSGGLLGANPIGAAGLVRFAEAAMQVRGTAGEHQVDGARLAVGHAAGGYSNCVAMWVVGRDRP